MKDQITTEELLDRLADPQDHTLDVSQRRSIIAIAIGCLLIGTCLYFFAAFMALWWDPVERFRGVLGIFPGSLLLWFAFRQYRALFSCDSDHSRSLSGCFYVMASIVFTVALAMGLEVHSDQNRSNGLVRECIITLAITVVILLIGVTSSWNNRRRAVVHPNPELLGKHPPFFKRYWKRDVAGLLILGIITAGILYYDISGIPPGYAENVPYEQMVYKSAFPKEGRDYSYIRFGRGAICCEFTIDEQSFRNWIASKETWEFCRPIEEDDHVTILPRSAYRKGDFSSQNNNEESSSRVFDGLYAGYGEHHGCRAVFDRTTQRVYYWTYY